LRGELLEVNSAFTDGGGQFLVPVLVPVRVAIRRMPVRFDAGGERSESMSFIIAVRFNLGLLPASSFIS
jgi:hypothetical protein